MDLQNYCTRCNNNIGPYCKRYVFVVNCITKRIDAYYFAIKCRNILIRTFVLPIADSLYPVFDIEKIDSILDLERNINPEFNAFEIELTQTAWNSYVVNIQSIPKDRYDVFDLLISQKIEQINFTITLAINRSDTGS